MVYTNTCREQESNPRLLHTTTTTTFIPTYMNTHKVMSVIVFSIRYVQNEIMLRISFNTYYSIKNKKIEKSFISNFYNIIHIFIIE